MNFFKSLAGYLSPALLVGALAVFCLIGAAQAQRLRDLPPPPPSPRYKPKPTPTPAPTPEDVLDVVRITSNLVMVPVSAIDNKGQPIRGLQAADFRLEEAGQPQQIAEIGNPDEVPLEIALLIDVSGSTNARFVFEKEAAANFLKQVLKPVDHLTLYLIDRTPVLKLTNASADAATTGLLSVEPAADKGPTAFFDTVVAAAQYLMEKTPARHRRVILVISDGDDTYSEKIKSALGTTRAEQEAVGAEATRKLNERVVAEVQRDVQRADAVFYSINPAGNTMHLNVRTKRGQDGMHQLAEATGGNAFVPNQEGDLAAVFSQIAAELRGQYLLQYYSNSQAAGLQFRNIKVTIPAHADVQVRARQGYYPKAK